MLTTAETTKKQEKKEPVGQPPEEITKWSGITTFALLPFHEAVSHFDIAILGVPFDSGVTYRPGARFGPSAIRQASRLLRGYHVGLDVEPFRKLQVVDAGDVTVTPFDIPKAISQIQNHATSIIKKGARIIAIGGDHTISLPLLRSVHSREGPVALVHFDAHLDTWDSYLGQQYTHASPFVRAAEEGLFIKDKSMHVGIRGPLFTPDDLTHDVQVGFTTIHTMDIEKLGTAGISKRIREVVGDSPVYISIDIDVLDPSAAPGTGTPEVGGFSSRELQSILRGLVGLNIVGGDLMEVAPAYDHAEITSLAASQMVYEILCLIAKNEK